MQNLRDQLLKAGLANKEQKQQIETEKRRKAEETAQEQQHLAHEAKCLKSSKTDNVFCTSLIHSAHKLYDDRTRRKNRGLSHFPPPIEGSVTCKSPLCY